MMTKRMWAVAAAVLACLRLSGGHALGQAAQVFFQAVDDGDIRPLMPEEKQGLQDPFFQLVLKNNPSAVKLSDIEGLLQPDATQRRTFVLDEEIRDPALRQSRRMVLAFDGTNGGIKLDNNVMVSVFFDSDAIPEVTGLSPGAGTRQTPSSIIIASTGPARRPPAGNSARPPRTPTVSPWPSAREPAFVVTPAACPT
jgi:hypothetical protein